MPFSVNTERNLIDAAERLFRRIFAAFPEAKVSLKADPRGSHPDCDLAFEVVSGRTRHLFAIDVKRHVSPPTALAAAERMRRLPRDMIPVLFSETISPRVAEVLRGQGVCYADVAGNCWLRSSRGPMLIEREGFKAERLPTRPSADPFSPKSSRIIRAMLTRPAAGWKVRELAAAPDVQVSLGLVVKVKRALVNEGYVIEHQKRLYLRDPVALLRAWSGHYPGPAEQVPVYLRGETSQAERAVSDWCRGRSLRHAVAGFSAAWRHAPTVRYATTAVYVNLQAFRESILHDFTEATGAKRVETGPTLFLWRPFDESVFASPGQSADGLPLTSPLQTYLDLKRAGGRADDAANAIYEKHLSPGFEVAARQAEGMRDGVA